MSKNLEWLNLNSERNYPIAETASRFDTTNNIQLPNNLIVDAVFITDINNSFHISSAIFHESIIVLNISDQDNIIAGAITIIKSAHSEYDSYNLSGVGIYRHLRAKLVIGNIDKITIIGTYYFNFENTKFEHTVIIPTIQSVNNIIVNDVPITNNITLSAGYNVRLRVEEGTNTIYIDAISGEGLGEECQCTPEEQTGEPILTINGIRPTSNHNFDIRGIGCIEVNSITNGIEIKNICEAPCCDCDDVEMLSALLQQKEDEIAALEARVLALEN